MIDYIDAEEVSSASFSGMSTTNTIAGAKSSYKQLQARPQEKEGQARCKYCGGKHPGDSSPSSRQQHCRAYNKKCTSCDKLHHFTQVCRSSPKTAAAAMTTPPDPVNGALTSSTTMSLAIFYAMQSVPSTKSEHLPPYVAALSADRSSEALSTAAWG